MYHFRKITLSFFLAIFGFFLLGGIFHVQAEGGENIIMSGYTEPCTWNMQCEMIDESHYICTSDHEILGSQGPSITQIPVGKYNGNLDGCVSWQAQGNLGNHSEKKILYQGPDPYLYPFVSTIKIQV